MKIRIKYLIMMEQSFSEMCSGVDMALELGCDSVLIVFQRFKL